ncbi:MAG: hypothetical protein ACREBS_07685 [Nitrososphaerales archaeon]
MAEYRVRTLATAAIAIIAALSIGLGVYIIQPQLGTAHTSTTSSNCLVSVLWQAYGAGPIVNSSFIGFVETYPNGTESIFPAESCPQPVPSSLYSLVSAIETNSNFTRAENGSQFLFWTFTNSSASHVGSSGYVSEAWTNLYFNSWSHVHEFVNTCGYDYYNISQIVVNVPVNSQGYDLSNATVSNAAPFEMNACQGAARS